MRASLMIFFAIYSAVLQALLNTSKMNIVLWCLNDPLEIQEEK